MKYAINMPSYLLDGKRRRFYLENNELIIMGVINLGGDVFKMIVANFYFCGSLLLLKSSISLMVEGKE